MEISNNLTQIRNKYWTSWSQRVHVVQFDLNKSEKRLISEARSMNRNICFKKIMRRVHGLLSQVQVTDLRTQHYLPVWHWF